MVIRLMIMFLMLFLSFVLLQWDARDLSPSQLQLLHELVTWPSFVFMSDCWCPIMSDWWLIRIEVVVEIIRLIDPHIEPIRRPPTWSCITHARSSHAFPSLSLNILQDHQRIMPRRKTTTKKPNERKMLKPVGVR